MTVLYAITSILFITVLVWLINRTKSLPSICAICVGVFLTWLWLLAAHHGGFNIDLDVAAILMGGSVVGLAYTAEKKLVVLPSGLLFRTLITATGFLAAYFLLNSRWLEFVPAVAALLIIYLVFTRKRLPVHGEGRTQDIKDKLGGCC